MLTALVLVALAASDEAPAPQLPDAPEVTAPRSPDAPVIVSPERSARLLERAELERIRPRILSPLLLTTGGIAAGLGGVAFVWAGLFTGIYYAFSFAVGSVVLLSVGIVLFAVAIPLTALGAVKLHRARKERQRIDRRLEELDEQEAQLQTIATF